MARRLIDQNPQREQRRQSLLLDRLEVSFRNRMRAELTRAMGDMLRVYELTGEVPPARDHTEQVEALFRSMAVQCATTFGARIIQQGKDAGHVLETKGFAETMARLALQYVGSEAIRRRITSIAETTRAQIVNAVSRGYDAGLGVQAIAKLVRDQIPAFSRQRAALIARTETHGAANFGAQEAAKETGLQLRKEWVAASDERTRESHVEADGQIVGMDEPFIIGGVALMYPGDPDGPPEETINCRCAVAHVVID
jgi:SPP1 gp7 family putative phage head morphogenesis protein